MKVLILLIAVQFICRLSFQTTAEAVASTLFLSLFVILCYRLGGWSSLKSAKQWLIERPLFAWLISFGVTGVVVLALFDTRFSILSIIAEAIGSYFVFHAFCALGSWIVGRFRKT